MCVLCVSVLSVVCVCVCVVCVGFVRVCDECVGIESAGVRAMGECGGCVCAWCGE